MATIKLWGFSHSTYVRTVRMVLADKGVTNYEQMPVNVLKGEPKQPEHLKIHPFGKVPVIEVDGFRIIETPAIIRYLDAVLPGRKVVPADPKNAARMDMVMSIIDSYGYGPMLGGAVAYHLFPEFVGGKNDEAHRHGVSTGQHVLRELMTIKGNDPWLAGPEASAADYYLAPVMAYVSLIPEKSELFGVPGMEAWWDKVSALDVFKSTEP